MCLALGEGRLHTWEVCAFEDYCPGDGQGVKHVPPCANCGCNHEELLRLRYKPTKGGDVRRGNRLVGPALLVSGVEELQVYHFASGATMSHDAFPSFREFCLQVQDSVMVVSQAPPADRAVPGLANGALKYQVGRTAWPAA